MENNDLVQLFETLCELVLLVAMIALVWLKADERMCIEVATLYLAAVIRHKREDAK